MKGNLFIGLIIAVGLVLTVCVYAQGYVFGPNVRVSDYPPASAYAYTPNAGQRGVAVRGDTVYCVWADSRTGGWGVWFVNSIDGGQTFLPNVQVDDGSGEAYIPTIAVGNDGTIYIAWDGEPSPFNYKQVFFSKSTDGGLTFTPDIVVNDTAGGLKNYPHREPSMAVDTAGIIYIAFDDGRSGPGNYDIYFSKSTDGGATFPNDILVNDTTGDTWDDNRPALALSDDGDIYCSWSKDFKWLYVTKSTDGGLTFGFDVQVNDTVAESWQNSIDVDSRGYVHVCWRDGRDPFYNIYYSRSTDGGLTFVPDILVNDSINESVPHVSPSMCADDSGIVYAVWEDGLGSSSDIFFTLSTDNADSVFVEPNVRVDNTDSLCAYPSIAVGDSEKVYVLWIDFRNGFFANDVFFSVGKYESGVEEVESPKPEFADLHLKACPNPFTSSISIMCSGIKDGQAVSLEIFDVSGRLVKDFSLPTAEYQSSITAVWDGKDEISEKVPTGVYFIKLIVGTEEFEEKIIYVK